MKETPILFSAPLIRAILDGSKIQTRRMMNPQPEWNNQREEWKWHGRHGESRRLANAYGCGCAAGRQAAESMGHRHPSLADGRIDREGHARAMDGHWQAADWLLFRDGRWRPVEPGTFPLADGVPARVGRLRAYGNAIVPQAAAEFVRGCLQ